MILNFLKEQNKFKNNSLVITDNEVPTAPSNLVISNITDTTVDLTWTASTDNVAVSFYRVYNNDILFLASTGNVTSYQLLGLTENTEYNLTVRAIDSFGNESTNSNLQTITTSLVTTNTPEETAYFNATLVTSANSSTIQSVLDSDGAVRLGDGDYTACPTLTLTSNMRLYGYPEQNGTQIGGDINIAAGSSNIHVEGVDATSLITFISGSPITNCTFKSIYYSSFRGTNVQLENNTFIDLNRCGVQIDCSGSGYLINNVWTRVFAQSADNHVILKGNDVTPSYGNIEIARNLLTSQANTTEYDNLDSHTIVGCDAEYWNQTSAGIRAAWYFRNIGRLNFYNSFGYSTAGDADAPDFDFEADYIRMQRRDIGSPATPIIRTGSKLLYVQGGRNKPTLEGTAWGMFAYHSGGDIDINGTDVSGLVTGTDATNLQELIYDTEKTPFARPNLPTLPNPTGANWSTDRTGQTDQSAFIQNLIDTNGVAELDEGIYYISQSLVITNGQGIIGKGTGKTAIVGITDDFPLILAQDNLTGGTITGVTYPLAYLTLQGGSKGLHIDPINKENVGLQITSWNFKHVVFRNQTNGVHFDQFYALDNSLIDNVSFVDCNVAWFQDALTPNPNGSGEYSQNMYIDKTMFYQCQFINNTTAFSMTQCGARPNNLNSWVNCEFDGNGTVLDMNCNNAIFMANCDITNNTGSYLFATGSGISFYSCDFTGNSGTAILENHSSIYAEGCNFNDNIPLSDGTSRKYYISNSNVTSTINKANISQAIFMNSNIVGDATLSKPMVEVISGTPLTILDGTVDVYPQLLVKQ